MYRILIEKHETEGTAVINQPSTGKWIPMDESNTDYQEYLAWLAEGNEPLVVEED